MVADSAAVPCSTSVAADLTFPDALTGTADEAARRLLGCHLIRELDGARLVVRVVEVEAYDQNDPASHTFHGKSHRNRAMFGPAGHAYIYLTYGMYHCINVTAGVDGFGSGVLLRAAEPLEGTGIIEERRGKRGPTALNGPAKLCMALGIDMDLYGHDLTRPPLRIELAGLKPGEHVDATERIGISKAVERRRRYIIEGNLYLSR